MGHHTALFRSAPRHPPSLPRPRPGMALLACRSHRALGPRSFPLGRALKSSGSTTIAPGRPSARGPGLLLPPPGLRSPGPGLLPRLAGASASFIKLFQRSQQSRPASVVATVLLVQSLYKPWTPLGQHQFCRRQQSEEGIQGVIKLISNDSAYSDRVTATGVTSEGK